MARRRHDSRGELLGDRRAGVGLTVPPEEKAPPPLANSERRSARRLKLEQPVLIRPSDPRFAEEILTTTNYSRGGLFFVTRQPHYYAGMHVEIVFPYRVGDPMERTIPSEVVRVERNQGDAWGVAIKFLLR